MKGKAVSLFAAFFFLPATQSFMAENQADSECTIREIHSHPFSNVREKAIRSLKDCTQSGEIESFLTGKIKSDGDDPFVMKAVWQALESHLTMKSCPVLWNQSESHAMSYLLRLPECIRQNRHKARQIFKEGLASGDFHSIKQSVEGLAILKAEVSRLESIAAGTRRFDALENEQQSEIRAHTFLSLGRYENRISLETAEAVIDSDFLFSKGGNAKLRQAVIAYLNYASGNSRPEAVELIARISPAQAWLSASQTGIGLTKIKDNLYEKPNSPVRILAVLPVLAAVSVEEESSGPGHLYRQAAGDPVTGSEFIRVNYKGLTGYIRKSSLYTSSNLQP